MIFITRASGSVVETRASVFPRPADRGVATSTAGSPGFPPGTTRYGYLINIGGKPAWIETSGTAGSATYQTNVSVVNLMASKSTIIDQPLPQPL